MSTDGLNLISALCITGSPRGLSRLSDEWFTEGDEQAALRFVRLYVRRNRSYPDATAVRNETGVLLPPPRNTLDYWEQRVINRTTYNLLLPEFSNLRDLLGSRGDNQEGILTTLNRMQSVVRTNVFRQDTFGMMDAVQILRDKFDLAVNTRGMAGIPTGHEPLDEMTGGWQDGDLNILVARPSVGKTFHLLKSVLSAMEAGYSVLLCSMEMPVDQIMRRIAGMLAGIDPVYIKKGRLSNSARAKFFATLEALEINPLLTVVSGGMKKSVGQLDPTIAEVNPDLVAIDGIYLMMSDRSQRLIKRSERMESVVSEIKEHTLTGGKPYLCTSQYNRGSGKGGKDGNLESIGYSDAVGTDSSIVLSLKMGVRLNGWRDTRILEVLKGRDGESGGWLVGHTFTPPNFEIICPYNDRSEENGGSNNAGATTQTNDQSGYDWTPPSTERPS